MAKVTTSYNNWNFNDQHVQQNLNGGDFIGSHTIILCATAPNQAALVNGGSGITGRVANTVSSDRFSDYDEEVSLDSATDGIAIPLGVVSDIGINQQRQINKIYEIGSKLSYTVSARTNINLSLSRVMYHGPNLLRMLYAYYPESLLGGSGNALRDMAKYNDSKMAGIALDADFASRLPSIDELAGYDNIFLNAASDLFSQPIGLVMYIKDNIGDDVAAVFFEDCNLVTHQFGVSQNSVVVAEAVQMTADKITPVKVNVRSSQVTA